MEFSLVTLPLRLDTVSVWKDGSTDVMSRLRCTMRVLSDGQTDLEFFTFETYYMSPLRRTDDVWLVEWTVGRL